MALQQLFDMQARLDHFIESRNGITYDVFQEKALGLLVELAELSNETRCFKYWSTKGASQREVILEEFVDSIHFMLSLGNMRNFSIATWPQVATEQSLTSLFIETTAAIVCFIEQQTRSNYEAIWMHYAKLAYVLQFTIEQILEAYIKKNEKNYERQRTGY